MKPEEQECWIKVTVSKRLPELEGYYTCMTTSRHMETVDFHKGYFEKRVIWWLEKQTRIVLTPEELEAHAVGFLKFIETTQVATFVGKDDSELYEIYLNQIK